MTQPLVTGTDNPRKQVSVSRWNSVMADLNNAVSVSPASILNYAVNTEGLADCTDGLVDFIVSNVRAMADQGDYRIDNAGDNAGGVEAELTQSLVLENHPRAVFRANLLDNDIMRLTVPASGPAEQIQVRIKNGLFDMRQLKVSTSVPHGVAYPPPSGLQGTSATTDGLSLRFSYDGGTQKGASYVEVDGVTFYAGDHWQSAGGDSGLYAGDGAEQTVVKNCLFIGTRDVGAYFSREGTGTSGDNVTIHNCLFINCFAGTAAKRGLNGFRSYNNTFVNCVYGDMTNYVAGVESPVEGLDIHGNRYINCQVPIRLDYAQGGSVYANQIKNIGCSLENGSVFPEVFPAGLTLKGCSGIDVYGNRFSGIASGYTAATTNAVECGEYSVNGSPVQTTYCSIYRNRVIGLRTIGEELNSTDFIEWASNTLQSTSLPGAILLGTHSTEMRQPDLAVPGWRYFIGATDVGRITAADGWRFELPARFPGYTFATMPSAASYVGYTIRVTDRSQRLATSDGSNWRFTDGTVVS